MDTQIYLVRHGAIDNGPPKCFIGQTDLPLNNEGKEQAWQLKAFFRNITLSRIVTSRLKRTIQTAEIITGLPGKNFDSLPELNEIHLGAWEGCPIQKIQETQPELYAQRGKNFAGFRPPGGESFQDLADRCWPSFQALVQQNTFPLLIVAHAGVNRVLLAGMQDISLQEIFTIKQPYCMVNSISIVKGKYTIEQLEVCLNKG
ncbi:MAG: histidine phosphatase family protein [Desulfobulbus propionicus]|nr:MAG: histidine phosphatase family protein [Desulfobulbus propionicus]PIE60434.1 MAG: histidine phosphatase family protein [Desulfobulbus propionicus]